MKNVDITLIRNNSGTNLFTFLDEETSEEVLVKEFQINETHSMNVRDGLYTFKIINHNNNDDFDFVSSSLD